MASHEAVRLAGGGPEFSLHLQPYFKVQTPAWVIHRGARAFGNSESQVSMRIAIGFLWVLH